MTAHYSALKAGVQKALTRNSGTSAAARMFLLRLACAAALVLLLVVVSRAGGPKYVAGSSYFDPSVTGQPLVWPAGVISYYTDQGDLSSFMRNTAANAFVADAFSQWTSVPTAALSAANRGQLAENVSGLNVTVSSGVVSMPADIQPTATATPIGIVYDEDGSVTDALLGSGAGTSGECFFNAVFGGADNYGTFATYQHALIVINGVCAQNSLQLPDVEYRLVRVIGSVLGMGWSQMNVNVQNDNPAPVPADLPGFPVMHFTDFWNCVPMTICYPAPYQLSADDVAAVSRLYPVTAGDVANFPGKQVFSDTTARISGSVWFTDVYGNRAQPMQGVNVVARWIDSSTGKPSRQFAVASVSGFLFSGNAGNPVSGFSDALGQGFDQWGSPEEAVQGFFDLAGLPLPTGGSAQYQLSVEGLDPMWSPAVGPYSPGPVWPSGSASPITLTVSAGSDVQQDILMTGTAQPVVQLASSWTAPVTLPLGGDWTGSLESYGDIRYFLLPVQANRTLSVAVTALDETGKASEIKAQPVVGIWAASDPEGTDAPAFTPSPFNELVWGMTRLDAQVFASENSLIGISDVRGDGRPDYQYHAHVLYADTVSPSRVSVKGGPVNVNGTGFATGYTSTVAGLPSTALAVNSIQMKLAAPPHFDGAQDIAISDPVSGASTVMTGALLYGAAATDTIVLIYGLNPSTPVGTQAANPVSVRVLAADRVTPVSGATIGWTASNNLQLSACAGLSSCSVISDQDGNAATWLTPTAVGLATITATLAPGVYNPSSSVSTTLNATESSSDIGAANPYLWISQGATVSIPLTTRVLSNGTPQSAKTVIFTVVDGVASLSNANALTNSTGYATATLSVTGISALVQVSACVSPANAPCTVFYANPVPLPLQNLQQVAGAGQVSTGAGFQPLVVRVIDSSSPPNPVIAAPVLFQTTTLRPGGFLPGPGDGETNSGNPAMPVILSVTQNGTTSDINGLASITPVAGNFSPPVEVDVSVTAGTQAVLDDPLQLLPGIATGASSAHPARDPIRTPMHQQLQ